MKTLKDLPTEQLHKMRKSYLAIMLVPLILLVISLVYAVSPLWKGDSATFTLIIIPLVLIGAMFPSYMQFGRVNNELKRRRTIEH